MQGADFCLQVVETRGRGLDDHERFAGRLDRSFPAVDRLDARQDIHARGELRLHERAADRAGFLGAAKGAENEHDFVGHDVERSGSGDFARREIAAARGTVPAITKGMKFIAALALFVATPLLARADELASQVLAEINRARTAPQSYAAELEQRLANYNGREGHRVVEEAVRFLRNQQPLPPLAASTGLKGSARLHVAEQGATGNTGHGSAFRRMARFGRYLGAAGENIDYGRHDARSIVTRLIVDDGVRNRGHRKNIFSSNFHLAGVATGGHARYGAMCVIDFAAGFVEADSGRFAGL